MHLDKVLWIHFCNLHLNMTKSPSHVTTVQVYKKKSYCKCSGGAKYISLKFNVHSFSSSIKHLNNIQNGPCHTAKQLMCNRMFKRKNLQSKLQCALCTKRKEDIETSILSHKLHEKRNAINNEIWCFIYYTKIYYNMFRYTTSSIYHLLDICLQTYILMVRAKSLYFSCITIFLIGSKNLNKVICYNAIFLRLHNSFAIALDR